MNLTHVRKAIFEDAQALVEISRITFYDTYHAFNQKENMDLYMDTYFSLSAIQEELNNPANTFLLYFTDQQLKGYVKLCDKPVPEPFNGEEVLEIARLYVLSSEHGKGSGKLLMEKSIEYARQLGKTAIFLIVWKENARALAFYRKCGFDIVGEQEFMLGTDLQHDWLMKKSLL